MKFIMKWREKIEPLNQNPTRLRVLSIQAKRIYPETEDVERENRNGIFTSDAKSRWNISRANNRNFLEKMRKASMNQE